jgi:hypothetical protein
MPSISESYLSGFRRRAVVEQGLAWPYDIAVDVNAKRIYWVDSKKHTLETVSTNGNDRRVLHQFAGE